MIITKNKLKTLGGVAIVSLICACQSYHQKHNTLNNGEPCPTGTQADKYGMECKPIVQEVIPENETKLQRFNRVLGKIGKSMRENEVLNPQQEFNCKDLDYLCKKRENEYYGRPTRRI